jgi:DNA invertase Pin-like site-specific DNA recombinase
LAASLEGDDMTANVETPIRAVQYVRMSTEHQQYSTENQSEVIAKYAVSHGMEIVRSYADLGKSGLTLRNRDGLRRLLQDVESGAADFAAILVYDISRWGRFQDADESAYYEYRCKRAKISVHYCAELFANDGSISSNLLKTLKRAMAGEFSRELSAKVFAGKTRLVELGFRQGGPAGHGLRRMLLDQDRKPKGLLRPGDRKSLFTDRVILVPGPEEEVHIVREIYERLVGGQQSPSAIARTLNTRGVANEYGRPWSLCMIRTILTNPKYIGVNLSNRTSYKLHKTRISNPPEMWVRRDNAFTAIVDSELFRQAQRTMEARARHATDDELLARLQALREGAGGLTGPLIEETPDMPSRSIYNYRFGGLLGAYSRIGYVPPTNYSHIEDNRRLLALQAGYIAVLIADLESVGASVKHQPGTQLLQVNDEYSIFFTVVRCRHTKSRGDRWLLPHVPEDAADIRIAARMASDNQSIFDYYAFPRSVRLMPRFDLGVTNSIFVDVHRFSDLSFVTNLARRSKIEEAL